MTEVGRVEASPPDLRRLRIVVVVIEAPLASGSAAGRWYEAMVRELAGRGHEVSVFAACSRGGDVEATRGAYEGSGIEVFPFVFPVRGGLLSKLASLRRPHSYMFSSEFRRAFDGRVGGGGCDVVHLEQLWSGWLAPKGVPSLVHVHYLFRVDVAAPVRTVGARFRRRLTLHAERRLLRRSHTVTALSAPLAHEIDVVAGRTDRTQVVPFALGLDRYPFMESSPENLGPVIGLVGSMDWEPTASAARRVLQHVWPLLRELVPDARLVLVGWHARSVLADFLNDEGVEIIENVPDTRPYFQQLRVMLYPPDRSSGVKVKVVEALALGVPVVTNCYGAEGLAVEAGVDLDVADDDAELARCTAALLQDPLLWAERRRAGRGVVESQLAPARAVDALEAVYARLVGRESAS